MYMLAFQFFQLVIRDGRQFFPRVLNGKIPQKPCDWPDVGHVYAMDLSLVKCEQVSGKPVWPRSGESTDMVMPFVAQTIGI